MDDMLDIIQEMLEEGFTQEQAQFIAANRCFGSIAYKEKNLKEEK